MSWKLSFKPAAFHALSANVPKNDLPRVLRGLDALCEDPTPNGSQKRKLKHAKGLFRCKVHGFRVMYVFDDTHVSVLDIRPREDDHATYSGLPAPEHQGAGPDADLPEAPDAKAKPASVPPPFLEVPASESTALPRPITEELLAALRVPEAFWAALTACDSEEALLDCDAVPEQHRLAVVDGLVGRPVEELLAQPDLLVPAADDLLRYREGELLGFLLRLDPEQEKFVHWAADAKGPTLLKGGPGTGKSTVALHRVKVFVQKLRAAGVPKPRILFTTYTRALTRVSEQLLEQLLGEDAKLVEVSTADSVAAGIVRRADGNQTVATFKEQCGLFEQAMRDAKFEGNALQVAAQRKTLERTGTDYLMEEVLGVIEARALADFDAYLETSRAGRRLPLAKTQRKAVWAVREAFVRLVDASGKTTWERLRARAAELTQAAEGDSKAVTPYDAVVVDEAQDLQPSALRMLVGLAKDPSRLFLTADANQSIYGAGFRWADVHEDLRFVGRTGVLRANHRSTRENAEAGESYLDGGSAALDREDGQGGKAGTYLHRGPVPVVRSVVQRDEVALVARFVRGATRALRLGTGSAAVLCPTRKQVQRITEGLEGAGIAALAVDADDLDLSSAGVKVMTLKSAKGLEFPVVVIAGLGDENFPALWTRVDADQRQELVERERRTMYVAMTRAMRALMVVLPKERRGVSLFEGFDRKLWNKS